MRRAGRTKAEAEEATDSTIGVYDAGFDVARNEIFVVIGLSGSGKSTLLRLLNNLVEPTDGEVYIEDSPVTRLSRKQLRQLRRRKMGMVFQHFGLLPNRTVMGNITYGLEIQGVSAEERERAGMETLDLVGLSGQADKQISELSGGMQQRVGLARALVTRQEVLLMDEPFSALDPLIRRDMQELLLNIQSEIDRTIVFITHDLDEALRLGHRVAIMHDSEIVQIGTPEQILANPADEYVEQFIAGVDYAKVRLAGSVMTASEHTAYIDELPSAVLDRMRRQGMATLSVVDRDHRLVGLVDDEKLADSQGGDCDDLGRILEGMPSVRVDTPLRDVIPLFVDSSSPIGVTDDAGCLQGLIARRALMGGLCTNTRSSNAEASEQPVLE